MNVNFRYPKPIQTRKASRNVEVMLVHHVGIVVSIHAILSYLVSFFKMLVCFDAKLTYLS